MAKSIGFEINEIFRTKEHQVGQATIAWNLEIEKTVDRETFIKTNILQVEFRISRSELGQSSQPAEVRFVDADGTNIVFQAPMVNSRLSISTRQLQEFLDRGAKEIIFRYD